MIDEQPVLVFKTLAISEYATDVRLQHVIGSDTVGAAGGHRHGSRTCLPSVTSTWCRGCPRRTNSSQTLSEGRPVSMGKLRVGHCGRIRMEGDSYLAAVTAVWKMLAYGRMRDTGSCLDYIVAPKYSKLETQNSQW